jgi:hypothetical protein
VNCGWSWQKAKEWEYVGDWSPLSGMTAYLADDDKSGYNLRLIQPNGKNHRRVGTIRAVNVKWSMVNSNMYYNDSHEIWRISPVENHPPVKVFTFTIGGVRYFDISPDDRWIVFSVDGKDDTEEEIYCSPLENS